MEESEEPNRVAAGKRDPRRNTEEGEDPNGIVAGKKNPR
jgi:hypothetical protein